MDQIFKVVQQMPRFPFPGSESVADDGAHIKEAAIKNMLEFIYHELQYPDEALEEKKQGRCVVKFIVEKDGSLSNTHLIRDIGSGCGDEALRLVKLMPQGWTPGKQRGVPVRVEFALPIEFKLN